MTSQTSAQNLCLPKVIAMSAWLSLPPNIRWTLRHFLFQERICKFADLFQKIPSVQHSKCYGPEAPQEKIGKVDQTVITPAESLPRDKQTTKRLLAF